MRQEKIRTLFCIAIQKILDAKVIAAGRTFALRGAQAELRKTRAHHVFGVFDR
jgi:hypothetical protein